MQRIPSPSSYSSSEPSPEHPSLFLSRYLQKVTLSTKPQQDWPLVWLRQLVPIKCSQSRRILSLSSEIFYYWFSFLSVS